MPVTILEELINGAKCRVSENGVEITRAFYLEGLTRGLSETDKAGVWHEVLQELESQKQVGYGRVHPYDSTLVCKLLEPSPFATNSRGSFRALAMYGPPNKRPAGGGAGALVKYDAWVENVVTSRDRGRQPIVVYYKPEGGAVTSQVAKVSGSKALGRIVVEREFTGNPDALSLLTNKINGSPFRNRPKWTVRCSGIHTEPTSTSGTHLVIGTFDYDEHTWRKAAFWLDPTTGEPPLEIIGNGGSVTGSYKPDVDRANGYANPFVNFEGNFNFFA